jgi:hypothetical protein
MLVLQRTNLAGATLPPDRQLVTIGRMEDQFSRRLSRDEANALRNALGPPMQWLKRICDRMDRLGISPRDEIYKAAYEAYNAMHSLAVRAHYRSCAGGVAEPMEQVPDGIR